MLAVFLFVMFSGTMTHLQLTYEECEKVEHKLPKCDMVSYIKEYNDKEKK